MSDQKGENINGPPNYPGPPQPQAAYMMNNMPQPQSTGQQPQPGVQTQWEQTTTRTAMGGHPQMIPMQQQTMGQPQMMGMNTQMNMGTPQQPNSTGVMMNVIMPGGAGTNSKILTFTSLNENNTLKSCRSVPARNAPADEETGHLRNHYGHREF
jgi:hypothetical protein